MRQITFLAKPLANRNGANLSCCHINSGINARGNAGRNAGRNARGNAGRNARVNAGAGLWPIDGSGPTPLFAITAGLAKPPESRGNCLPENATW